MKALLSKFSLFLLAAVLYTSLSLVPAAAQTLYGVTLFGNELVSIDATTGVGSLVGPLSTTQTPYGIGSFGNNLYTYDSTANLIRQINPTTGGTVGSFNVGLPAVLGEGDLAFRQSDGAGFLATALDPATLNPVNDLYRFNIGTGTSTLVGSTSDTLTGLAFDGNGVLFGLGKGDGNLYIIDPNTAATTLVGNAGIAVGSPIGALTFAPNGVLYANLDDALYTLDPTTGLATAVDPTNVLGIGFSSVSGITAVVPEPSAVVLMASLLVPGVFALRRRRK